MPIQAELQYIDLASSGNIGVTKSLAAWRPWSYFSWSVPHAVRWWRTGSRFFCVCTHFYKTKVCFPKTYGLLQRVSHLSSLQEKLK